MDELHEPAERTAVYSMTAALPVVGLLYVTTNAAYMAVLPPDQLAKTSAVALAFADRVDTRSSTLRDLMALLVALSALGTINALMLIGSRLLCVGANRRHLPLLFANGSMSCFLPKIRISSVKLIKSESVVEFLGKGDEVKSKVFLPVFIRTLHCHIN